MAIKFICGCGKHLRARDEMASRRSVCPRCGSPVGIPSLRPTHPGTALGPMTPDERRRARKNALPAPLTSPGPARHEPDRIAAVGPVPAPRPLNLGAVHVLSPEESRREAAAWPGWPLETRWYQCLLYPLRAWRLVLVLAGGLAVLTGAPVQILVPRQEFLVGQQWPFLFAPLFVYLLLACGFLQRVLASARAGEPGPVRPPACGLALLLRSVATWLVCFLAGPALLAAGGFLYWLHCGDLDLLDELILAELVVLAVGSWLLLLLAVSQRGRLLDANPLAVARLVGRVGDRLVVAALAGGVAALAHGRLLLAGLEELHRRPGMGGLLLAGCWLSGLFGTTFLLRLLGVWCHRAPGGSGEPNPLTSADCSPFLPEMPSSRLQ
ncbi:MAG: hypothetical protein HYS12_11420 [Planctomycetes bacterium]|nr:hypothetical protein [Planctomycetota bacterium]